MGKETVRDWFQRILLSSLLITSYTPKEKGRDFTPEINSLMPFTVPYVFPENPFKIVLPDDPPEPEPPKEGALSGVIVGIDPGHHHYWNVGATGKDEAGRVLFDEEGTPLYEHLITLKIAYKLKGLLEQEGAAVCVTRNEKGELQIPPYDFSRDGIVRPIGVAIEDVLEVNQPRIDYLNQCGAKIVFSSHFNGGDKSLRGTEVYFPDLGEEKHANWLLAKIVHDTLLEEMRADGYEGVARGVKSEKYDRYDRQTFLRILTHHGFDESCEDCKRLQILGNNPMAKNRLEAPHRVLVEVDFLSNPFFAQHLTYSSFQETIARGLAKGIVRFAETEYGQFILPDNHEERE